MLKVMKNFFHCGSDTMLGNHFSTEDYTIEFDNNDIICSGSQGLVCRATMKSRREKTSTCIALKIEEGMHDEEVNILKQLEESSAHNIHYYTSWCSNQKTYIAMDICDSDLLNYLTEHGLEFSEKELLTFANWLITSVKECHSKFICHLDIKPENIGLLKLEKGIALENLKLLDFGISHIFNSSTAPLLKRRNIAKKSSYYPENIKDNITFGEGKRIDCYSIAATIHAAFHKLPFPYKSSRAEPRWLILLKKILAIQTFTSVTLESAFEVLQNFGELQ